MTDGAVQTQGVDFSGFDDVIGAVDYPVSCEELVETHGDAEIEHRDGSEQVADVLGPLTATFRSPDEVRTAVVGALSTDAVGRPRYTDRGGTPPEAHGRAPADTL